MYLCLLYLMGGEALHPPWLWRVEADLRGSLKACYSAPQGDLLGGVAWALVGRVHGGGGAAWLDPVIKWIKKRSIVNQYCSTLAKGSKWQNTQIWDTDGFRLELKEHCTQKKIWIHLMQNIFRNQTVKIWQYWIISSRDMIFQSFH